MSWREHAPYARFLPRSLVHVDVAPDAMDGVRMWSAIYALLSERYL